MNESKLTRILKDLEREMGTGWFFNYDKASLDHLLAQTREPGKIRQSTRSRRSRTGSRDDLEAALEQFREIAADVGGEVTSAEKAA